MYSCKLLGRYLCNHEHESLRIRKIVLLLRNVLDFQTFTFGFEILSKSLIFYHEVYKQLFNSYPKYRVT